jgi:hypothetical protein
MLKSKRGGARPGFGGRQPGAGRPPKPVTGPISLTLDADTARLLDQLRGELSRAAFVRSLLADIRR